MDGGTRVGGPQSQFERERYALLRSYYGLLHSLVHSELIGTATITPTLTLTLTLTHLNPTPTPNPNPNPSPSPSPNQALLMPI